MNHIKIASVTAKKPQVQSFLEHGQIQDFTSPYKNGKKNLNYTKPHIRSNPNNYY